MIRESFAFGALLTASVLGGRSVDAQTRAAAEPRIEVGAGPVWIGYASFGDRNATEPTGAGGSFALFSTSTSLRPVTGVEGRVGVRLTRLLRVEAAASYSAPTLETAIRDDAEGAAGVTAVDSIRQLLVEGDVVVSLTRLRIGGRAVPFVSGGAGFLRHLHEDATFLQTGWTAQGGGGLWIPLGTRLGARLKTVRIRAEARAVGRAKGAALDRTPHPSPELGASVFFGF